MSSWIAQLGRALRDLRGASRELRAFVRSLPQAVPADDLGFEAGASTIAIAIAPAGIKPLEHARAAAGSPSELPIELDLFAEPSKRGQPTTVTASFDGSMIGQIGQEDAERWAARVRLTTAGGQFTGTATLRHRPGAQPPYTLELPLPEAALSTSRGA